MGWIAGRLFSQQPFAWNCEKYANNGRHSAKNANEHSIDCPNGMS
jgi:hypothetical protein